MMKRRTRLNRIFEIESLRGRRPKQSLMRMRLLRADIALAMTAFDLNIKARKRINRGQSTIEFVFAMMVTLIMVFALFMVFRWAGLDLANRRFYHESTLSNDALRPEQQLNPDFYKPRKLDAAYRGFDLKR